MGRGLAARFVAAGESVFLGSRDEGRGAAASDELRQSILAHLPSDPILGGGSNEEAAIQGRLVVLTLPSDGYEAALKAARTALADKVVVSAGVPVTFVDRIPRWDDAGPGLTVRTQELLPESWVAGAFHTVSSATLKNLGAPFGEDVLIATDHVRARDEVAALVDLIGGRPVNAGGMAFGRLTEALAVLLLSVNKHHKANVGISLTALV